MNEALTDTASPVIQNPKSQIQNRKIPIGARGRMAYLVHEVGRGAKGAKDLTQEDAEEAARLILSREATDWQSGAFLSALRVKEEKGPEIAGFTEALRAVALRQRPNVSPILDLGGPYDRSSVSFQASPIVAMLCAALGVYSVLHGDGPRAALGETGPAELLMALGVDPRQGPDCAPLILETVGASYYWMPAFIPALAQFQEMRRGLGIRTAFNSAEKLVDFACADARMVGIFHGAYNDIISEALLLTGCRRGMVVQGMNGSEDLSPSRNTQVFVIKDGVGENIRITAADAGLSRWEADDLKVGGPEQQAKEAEALLNGEGSAPLRDLVLLNAAVRLWLLDRVPDIAAGAYAARDGLNSGQAGQILKQWRKAAPLQRAT
jgi:anthranilate phosphoribosyltransferase